MTGITSSTNFPTQSPLQANPGGGTDAFVAKLNDTGTGLVYSTYLGGSGQDKGQGIAVDGAGNAYVTGSTPSTNFPTANALQPTLGGGYDGFVAELNPTGSAFVYSTYLGGSSNDGARAIAVDGSGNAYVTGQTGSTNFGTTVGALQTTRRGYTDAFITKLSVGGTGLAYSTYLGGSDGGKGTGDVGTGIGVFTDSFGNTFAYVTGATESTDFPTTPSAYQTVNAGGVSDAFVAKLNTLGSALVYSTYLGGSGDDNYIGLMGAIAVDSAGNAYVTGETRSANFPVVNALQPTYAGGGADAFVAEFNAAGSVVYSTYFGGNVGSVGAGSGGDTGNGIAVDSGGIAYVTGATSSRDFPTMNALQATFGAGRKSHTSDAFVTKIAPSAPLMAASNAPAMHKATATPLTTPQVQPLLDEAIQRWLGAGADVSILRAVNVQFADLPGTTLGLASGNTITLDNNAASWGWFVDSTPGDDSDFLRPGNQGEMNRMDLLSVVMHELGHLLCHNHQEDGVMAETLAAGVRSTHAEEEHDAVLGTLDGQMATWLPDPVESGDARAKRRR